MVEGYQYRYQTKGLDLGIKNMLLVYRFSCLFTFYEYKQTNVNKSQFSEFTIKPYEYGYQMKEHNEKVTNMMLFCLLYYLFQFCNHKQTKQKRWISWLSEVQMFQNLVDAFNSTQYTMLKSYF